MGRTRKWPEDGARNLETHNLIPERNCNCIMAAGSSSPASYRTCREPPKSKRLDDDFVTGWKTIWCQWKGIAVVCFILISAPVSSYLNEFHTHFVPRQRLPQSDGQGSNEMSISLDDEENRPISAVWEWDHYLYNSQNSALPIEAKNQFLASNRNLLIVQVVGAQDGSDLHASMVQFSEISSRPNRAYARKWGRNFVRYIPAPPNNANFQCDGVDHVVILNAILDGQQPRMSESADSIPYDALVLLPPDAIITDLDYDLLAMIPKSRLVSFVGMQRRQHHTGEVVFWNLQHKLTHKVAQHLWNEMVRPNEEDDNRALLCESGKSYIDLLLDEVLPSVFKDDGDVRSLVESLDETSEGFVFVNSQPVSSEIDPSASAADPMPSYCLKCFPPTGSSSKTAQLFLSNPDAIGVTLQNTADAVCYRYYPKCEVL